MVGRCRFVFHRRALFASSPLSAGVFWHSAAQPHTSPNRPAQGRFPRRRCPRCDFLTPRRRVRPRRAMTRRSCTIGHGLVSVARRISPLGASPGRCLIPHRLELLSVSINASSRRPAPRPSAVDKWPRPPVGCASTCYALCAEARPFGLCAPRRASLDARDARAILGVEPSWGSGRRRSTRQGAAAARGVQLSGGGGGVARRGAVRCRTQAARTLPRAIAVLEVALRACVST